MSGYAVRNDGLGWRSVDESSDCLPGETFYLSLPILVSLAQAQAQAKITLRADFQQIYNTPVSFTNSAGITSLYPAGNFVQENNETAKNNLSEVILAGAGSWTLGHWEDVNGVSQVFTFVDLQNLAAAMEAVDLPTWTHLLTKLAAVAGTTSPEAALAITW